VLDTPRVHHYGAPDFEQRQTLIAATPKLGLQPMADPRDSEPPDKSGGKPSATGDLAQRIARARAERTPGRNPVGVPQEQLTGVARAYRLAAEFVAAIIVGAGLGFGIDAIFSTRPWATIILLLLGFAAGGVNVVRATAELNAATAVPPDTPALDDDEDD
jgi:ATP synthase protein I